MIDFSESPRILSTTGYFFFTSVPKLSVSWSAPWLAVGNPMETMAFREGENEGFFLQQAG